VTLGNGRGRGRTVVSIGPQQFWLGTRRTGEQVRFWIDTTTVHLSIDGWRIKTVPSRLSAVGIARLRQAGASAAGPPPAGPAPGALAATSCVEVQRLVNSSGIITLVNQVIAIWSPLAEQRVRIRLDGQVMHVLTQDGILWRTLPCPIPPAHLSDAPRRLQGRPLRPLAAGRAGQAQACPAVRAARKPLRRWGFGGSGNLVGVTQPWPSGGGPVPAVARIIEEPHHHGAERSSDDLTEAGDSQAGRWRR